ncbi:uncharacterized protein EAE97_003840 [Botrytis byssoidea]|uniref:BTB domain-containing protein n=1 Tax=Botrytis byssoidea TaxID=139641 RepID=A0A9P5ITX9_9HELO|nr:uncharacterized protein EAE97_003840 [Botrytis byssoidea]KAF7948429.1 hypothetical protein EAE97_003840 [Botrytis byssoidea]
MPPKAPRMQYQRGEQVLQVDDPGNHAFKAQPVKNSRKRPNTAQPSTKNGPIEIDSDNEHPQPSKKPRPDTRSSKSRIADAKKGKNVVENISESEDNSHPEVVPCANLPLRKLLKPFADHDADIYIALIQTKPEYSFRMHSYILRRASPWFAGQLQETVVNEVDEKLAAGITEDTGIKYRFELMFDDHLGYHTLKRVGLTMYKEQPQAVINRAIPDSSNRYDGYFFSGNVSSNSRQSSVFLPPYDGSCDDIEMANTMDGPNSSIAFNITDFLPSLSTIPPTQDSINEVEKVDNGIKLEDTTTSLNITEVNLPAQNDVTEQIATPPASPIKVITGTNTDVILYQGPQINIRPQAVLADQIIPTVDTPIKAEIKSEKQMFSPSLPEDMSPERQLEVLSNVEEKVDEQLRIELQEIEVPQGRQISPEEQLQVAISMGNPIGPEIKTEDTQQATISLSKQQCKIDPIVKEPSGNHVIEQTFIPTAEKPINNVTCQKLAPLRGVEQTVLDAYRSLFLCYFGCAPTISTTNAATAASQSMLLIKIANRYDSVKVVRPHIVAALLSLGRSLYASIRRNPPQYLLLANKLQCAPIFKEALIHIVGQYPSWPWLTKEDRMSQVLGKVIQMKFDDLQDMRFKINDALFQSCLVKEKVRVSINNFDKSTFDMWIIVQIWHDWFSQQLRQCKMVRRYENRSVEKNMYRLIAQGGEAYLGIDNVMAMIEPFRAGLETREWGHWKKDQVELQLNMLKKYASDNVKGLLVNQLMGDTGGNAGEIEYLTCTNVHEDELPWAQAQVVIIED